MFQVNTGRTLKRALLAAVIGLSACKSANPNAQLKDALPSGTNNSSEAMTAALAVSLAEQGGDVTQDSANTLGFTSIEAHPADGQTRIYILTAGNLVVVAFGLSPEAPAWISGGTTPDLVVPEGRYGTDLASAGVGARYASTVVQAVQPFYDDATITSALQAKIDASDDTRVIVAGHGAGGAMAHMFAYTLKRKFISVKGVYTFGAPKWANAAAMKDIDLDLGGRTFAFAFSADPVVWLPNDPAFVETSQAVNLDNATSLVLTPLPSSAPATNQSQHDLTGSYVPAIQALAVGSSN